MVQLWVGAHGTVEHMVQLCEGAGAMHTRVCSHSLLSLCNTAVLLQMDEEQREGPEQRAGPAADPVLMEQYHLTKSDDEVRAANCPERLYVVMDKIPAFHATDASKYVYDTLFSRDAPGSLAKVCERATTALVPLFVPLTSAPCSGMHTPSAEAVPTCCQCMRSQTALCAHMSEVSLQCGLKRTHSKRASAGDQHHCTMSV